MGWGSDSARWWGFLAVSGLAWEPDPAGWLKKSSLSTQDSCLPFPLCWWPWPGTLEPACPGGTWSRKGPPLCTRRPFRLRHKHFTQDVYKVHGHSERNGNLRVRAEKTGCRWRTMEQSCVRGHSHAHGTRPAASKPAGPRPLAPMPLKQQGQPHSQAQPPQIIPLLPMPYSPRPPIKPISIKV